MSDNRFMMRTTTRRGAEIIAKAISRHNPEAGRAYLDLYEKRREIEKAAHDLLEASYKASLN